MSRETQSLPAQTSPSQASPANLRTVFAGLMMGMFLAAVNQTIIAPAMPRIVAELGGMQHYSWIAVSALLASTVSVPIVGKLSDLYGRKLFYVGGILVFMASSLVAGLADSFWMFMAARILEGIGMGTMMPLSQAILGDLIAPRDRGRYQGLMGGVFGLASVIGPFIGGFITDRLSWRWLFFINVPSALVALAVIIPFMKLPHVRKPQRIDFAGFVTLSVGLTSVLLATVWGGTEASWTSPWTLGLFALGAASLALFFFVETRAAEPVFPLRLWKNDVFRMANLSILMMAMAMFGSIYFIPVFAQGVLGASVTDSGVILMPMMLSVVILSATTGMVVSRTGRYRLPVLLGIFLLGLGCVLLTQVGSETPRATLIRNMILIGAGLGMALQTLVVAVQNAVGRDDLGVATAATQLSRSIGSTVGVAVLGTVLAQRMAAEMKGVLPAGLKVEGGGEAGALLDPQILASLSPQALETLRNALAASLHTVFLMSVPFAVIAFVAALFLREIPLRRTIRPGASEAGKEILAEMSHSGAAGVVRVGQPNPAYQARLSFLGLTFGLLAREVDRADRPRLRELMNRLGEGDAARGRSRLEALSRALFHEGSDGAEGTPSPLAMLAQGTGLDLGGLDPEAEYARAVAEVPPALSDRLRKLLTTPDLSPASLLTPADVETLERVGIIVSAALLLDGVGNRELTESTAP
ncbi:MAG TPA: MDR family MFS transporter [Thermoanaerobaculia bacterium]|nr:MDR family MFS transporter [Thermoanaerobaculia bacterium]